MSEPTARELALQRVIAAYKRTRRIKSAAEAGPVPYSTATVWLAKAGLITSDREAYTGHGGFSRASGPTVQVTDDMRVDREPCFKCGVRRDVGCKHFPKQTEPERAATPRDKAEALWSIKP
jgi:hypothetical protein